MIAGSDPERVIRDAWETASGSHLLDVMQEVDIRTWLPNDLIPKMDIATMAHALEARSPFLDHELMEFAASIPADLKLPGMRKKGLLRDAVAPWLPPEILTRPKQGFCVPMADWLRTDLRTLASDILLDPAALNRGYFREAGLRSLLDRHTRGEADNSNLIWALMVHEMWRPSTPSARPGRCSACSTTTPRDTARTSRASPWSVRSSSSTTTPPPRSCCAPADLTTTSAGRASRRGSSSTTSGTRRSCIRVRPSARPAASAPDQCCWRTST
jgi:asparagine synthase (glutamine-hydrolysing)